MVESLLLFVPQYIYILCWLVVLGFTALRDSISVYVGPSPRERQKEKKNDRREEKTSTRTYC